MMPKITLPVFKAGQYVCVASGAVIEDRYGIDAITLDLVTPRQEGWIMTIAEVRPHPTNSWDRIIFLADRRLSREGPYSSIWFEHALNQPPSS